MKEELIQKIEGKKDLLIDSLWDNRNINKALKKGGYKQ